ncbi:MAG TPA: hypothetical protein VIN59_04885 [Alphaproteobacteria bacterium]
MTYLPLDDDQNPIPALKLRASGAHHFNVTGTAARNSTGFNVDTRIVSVYATGPVYLKFGDNTVTATTSDHYFPSGLYYDFAIGGDKTTQSGYISALKADTDCVIYISEKE